MGDTLVRPETAHQTRLRRLWRCCAVPLAALSILGTASGCPEPPPDCADGEREYEGECATDTVYTFLVCTEGRGVNLSKRLGASVGGTFSKVADASLKVAYEQSQQEDTAVALGIVNACIALAGDDSESEEERSVAREYQQRASEYIEEFPGVPVPRCTGRTEDDVTAALEDGGLMIGEVTTRPDKEFTPAEGTRIDAGSTVDLVVSSAAVGGVPVPRCIGRTQADVSADLEDVGLTVGDVATRPNEEFEAGQVVDCTPAEGAVLDPGGAVDLVVSSGPTSSPSPSPSD
jgi:hypothetical protein